MSDSSWTRLKSCFIVTSEKCLCPRFLSTASLLVIVSLTFWCGGPTQILLGLNKQPTFGWLLLCCDKNETRLVAHWFMLFGHFPGWNCNFITQEFQNSTELSIYFLQLLLSWQLAFGGSYIQKLPIGSYFILAKCGTESEVHFLPNNPPSPFLFPWSFLPSALYPFLPLPFPSVPPTENKKGLGTEAMPQIKGISFFVVAACNFGFC